MQWFQIKCARNFYLQPFFNQEKKKQKITKPKKISNRQVTYPINQNVVKLFFTKQFVKFNPVIKKL
jgi:hypothetical protein